MSGSRYLLSGQSFPSLLPWANKTLGLDMDSPSPPFQDASVLDASAPPPNINQGFVDELVGMSPSPMIKYSSSSGDRVDHSHGQTLCELYDLRFGKIKELVDMVVWPRSHEGVVEIVKLALKHGVGIIPFGGGTSVCLAVQRPAGEKRMVVSLDMKLMNRILELDLVNLTAVVEAGCVGQDLERELRSRGYCVGHEPDSLEFSTVGGWVATRASGMKKNTYGNIEDLVVNVRLVSGNGGEVLTRRCQGPRFSTGPDVNSLVIGSEGMFGVVTEVRLKVRPVPKDQIYGSLLMPSFESGFRVMREVALRGIQPASIRLMDPLQFQLGHTLKGKDTSLIGRLVSWIQKFYITRVLGFDAEKMSAITLLFEGDDSSGALRRNKREIESIAKAHGGMVAGSGNGERGYQMTYAIGYLREFSMDYHFVTESFETAVPWDRCLEMCDKVKGRMVEGVSKRGITFPPFVTCRVTQTYAAGCCVYFYLGFVSKGLKGNPAECYHDLESEARDEIEVCGGSLSHHHGVGKLRKRWMREAVSEQGLVALRGLKKSLDPQNIFCVANLIDVD